MEEKYYEDEDEILRGKCSNNKHKEFIGDAIGCPECFMEQESAEITCSECGNCRTNEEGLNCTKEDRIKMKKEMSKCNEGAI